MLIISANDVYKNLFWEGDIFLPISERWKNTLMDLGCNEWKIFVPGWVLILLDFFFPLVITRIAVLELKETLVSINHSVTLISSDERLIRASKNEGIHVFDPENDTSSHLQRLL